MKPFVCLGHTVYDFVRGTIEHLYLNSPRLFVHDDPEQNNARVDLRGIEFFVDGCCSNYSIQVRIRLRSGH
jgi:hypothetical protein